LTTKAGASFQLSMQCTPLSNGSNGSAFRHRPPMHTLRHIELLDNAESMATIELQILSIGGFEVGDLTLQIAALQSRSHQTRSHASPLVLGISPDNPEIPARPGGAHALELRPRTPSASRSMA
jgi:hypothetical protein